jgi:hypothetical protein
MIFVTNNNDKSKCIKLKERFYVGIKIIFVFFLCHGISTKDLGYLKNGLSKLKNALKMT